MALTLIEAAKLNSGDVLRSTIIELFARESDVLRVMPFDDIPGNSLKYDQEDTLPGIGFRGVNEAFAESTGVINPQTENLVIAGGDIDVDVYIVNTMGTAQRSTQETMKVKALSHTWSNTFIKGNSITTPKQFDGLQVRLTGDQVVSNNTGSGGGALSLNKLDEVIDTVDNPTHLLMSKAMNRRITQASRNTGVGGFVTYEQDEFGRRISMYQDLPILIADRNQDLFATLAFDEAFSGGGGSTGTSIYCLSLGEGMLMGLQNGTMQVRDLGELQSGPPVFRTRIEWYTSLVLFHPRAAGRLRDIADGAVIA